MDGVVTTVRIGGHTVGHGYPCFIVAEAGVNHNGDVERAFQLVEAAKEAGADAVKFQMFKAEQLASAAAPKAKYQVRTTGAAESQLAMLRKLELSADAHRALMESCAHHSILFLSSPFDESAADALEALDVAAFKIPSGELTNLPFLAHVAAKRRPMIVSTGMATLEEVEAGVRTIADAGNDEVILLHCVSNYPTAPGDTNLRAMATMAAACHAPVGFSDHTMGLEVALAAVALGAHVIEKHLTLDRSLPGPDHAASLEPNEFAAMVRGIRVVEAALGHGRKEPAASELDTAAVARKSIVAVRDLSAGTVLGRGMLTCKRPGTGLAPYRLSSLVGRVLRVDVEADTVLTEDMLR